MNQIEQALRQAVRAMLTAIAEGHPNQATLFARDAFYTGQRVLAQKRSAGSAMHSRHRRRARVARD